MPFYTSSSLDQFHNLKLAGVAQLVERHLPKVNVVSSNLITRLKVRYLYQSFTENAGVAQW